jgi:hypothetical protein
LFYHGEKLFVLSFVRIQEIYGALFRAPPCLRGKIFFVGLKNETENLQAIADWFFNIGHRLACVCTMQYEVSHE